MPNARSLLLVMLALTLSGVTACNCEGEASDGSDNPPADDDDDTPIGDDDDDGTGGGDDDDDGGVADNPDGSTGSGDDGGTETDAGDSFVAGDGGVALCGGVACACNNGLDDDGDGAIDGNDPECTGPGDDDEDTFGTGIPGDNRDPNCQDCFFDGNSGSGDDKCRYATSCLTDGTPTSGSGSCATCEASLICIENCRPLVPDGCDCFGCCEVTKNDGSAVFVVLGSDCSLETIDDCQTCMQSTECVNECGRCELCPGKDPEDLPDDCGGEATCDDEGATPCESTPDCPADRYCSLGCCIPSPLN